MSAEASPQRPSNWSGLTPEERREWRFDRWRDSARGVEFASPEAEAAYGIRLQRLIDVYKVEEPDRVPAAPPAGQLPLREAGIDYRTAIYEPEKGLDAVRAFNRQHAKELDSYASSTFVTIPARAFDILGLKAYAFPGHGMADDAAGFQFIEAEYMQADEYDAFIRDPSDFWLRSYFPRAYSVFEPVRTLGSLTSILEILNMPLWPLADPDVQTMLEQLLAAGKELSRYLEVTGNERLEGMVAGFPPAPMTGFATAPFDTLGDTLRGTRGILMDMLREPDKLLEALDVVADLHIHNVLASPAGKEGLRVFFPLHKGADGWMSEEQFLTFYWPSLKKVMDAFIEEGLMCSCFAEGTFNTRLDLVNEFPKGAVHWRFDRTDMARAKRILGARCCIEGNVPTSLLVTGAPEEVFAECRRLIEVCAPGGGYILGSGGTAEFPRLANLKAMAAAAREFGRY